MKKRILYFHIGFPKTGSTFLQRNIFNKLKNINYINSKEIHEITRRLTLSKLSNEDYRNIQERVYSMAAMHRNLISNESISVAGSFFLKAKNDRILLLKNIKRIFTDFEIKIIVCTRNFESMSISLYKQYIQEGGTKDIYEFMDIFSNASTYKYDNYIKKIKKIFGKDKTFVYKYEDFKKNKMTVLQKLMNFLGEKRVPKFEDKYYNKGYDAAQIKIARFFNRFFKTRLNPEGFLPRGATMFRLILQSRFMQILLPKLYEADILNYIKRVELKGSKE